ncbi:MAG: rhomboid family intramembrane serine protease [Planctomycetota bacterium]
MAFRPNWYDREPSARGGFGRPSEWSAFRWILTLTGGVFLLQLLMTAAAPRGGLLESWGALRALWPSVGGGEFNYFFPLQLLSYGLLHADTWHLLWNMLFLYFFGPELEAQLGRGGFLRLYIGGAVFGGLVQWAYWLATGNPGQVIGASGAVYTVMVLFALNWPHRVVLLFMILPVPVWLIAVLRVAFDLEAFVNNRAGSTAVLVHLGGAAFGLIWFKGGDVLSRRLKERRRRKAMAEFQEEAQDRREMDRILAKIQATGLGSLEPRERSFLERRSRELRDGGR